MENLSKEVKIYIIRQTYNMKFIYESYEEVEVFVNIHNIVRMYILTI